VGFRRSLECRKKSWKRLAWTISFLILQNNH
jgi:hypothetical protein